MASDVCPCCSGSDFVQRRITRPLAVDLRVMCPRCQGSSRVRRGRTFGRGPLVGLTDWQPDVPFRESEMQQ